LERKPWIKLFDLYFFFVCGDVISPGRREVGIKKEKAGKITFFSLPLLLNLIPLQEE